ncbi:MAG: DUF1564 domain-containing protein [Leptospira sp.]|nr:DUF1564 domain-containing protein [Leptospira sp.]
MVRRSFRPYDGDWAELKLIASMHGLTATFLFVVLIEMDFDQATAGKLDAAFEGVDPTELLAHPISFTQTIHKIPGKIKKYSRFWKNFHRFKTMQNH